MARWWLTRQQVRNSTAKMAISLAPRFTQLTIVLLAFLFFVGLSAIFPGHISSKLPSRLAFSGQQPESTIIVHTTVVDSPATEPPEPLTDISTDALADTSTDNTAKYAYAAFLSERNQDSKSEDEDYYYQGTRMLIYQLLHDPATRTNNSIPFVVLVTDKVEQWKRDQLVLDGAIVHEVEPINIAWLRPGRVRWTRIMDKINVFKMLQYEKVLLLDCDTVVVRPLDGVFNDPKAQVQHNKGNPKHVKSDEAPQPSQYLMAGNGNTNVHTDYPTPRSGKLNGGFILLGPSLEAYNYYMSVLNIENRFDSASMEQNLWNYAHRLNGNMPWQQVDPDWIINNPTWKDYISGNRDRSCSIGEGDGICRRFHLACCHCLQWIRPRQKSPMQENHAWNDPDRRNSALADELILGGCFPISFAISVSL